jgi:hypothetical protein
MAPRRDGLRNPIDHSISPTMGHNQRTEIITLGIVEELACLLECLRKD